MASPRYRASLLVWALLAVACTAEGPTNPAPGAPGIDSGAGSHDEAGLDATIDAAGFDAAAGDDSGLGVDDGVDAPDAGPPCVESYCSCLKTQDCMVPWGPSAACVAGVCRCTGGMIGCGGVCVNPMTDSTNCGACGVICNPVVRGCQAGVCACLDGMSTCALTSFESHQDGIDGVAVDGQNLYFAVDGNDSMGPSSTVFKMAIDGGAPVILASEQGGPDTVAVEGANVYWTNGANGTVMTVPVVGGTPSTLASGQPGADHTAVDATSVYWTTSGGDGGAVVRAPLDGGAASIFAAGFISSNLALDGENAYFAVLNTGMIPGPIPPVLSVVKAPLDGGTPITLDTSSLPSGRGPSVAVDGVNFYWMGPSAIVATPLDGGTPTTLATINIPGFHLGGYGAIATDGTTVYWTDASQTPSVVTSVPVAGGSALTVAVSQDNPAGIVVQGGTLFWANAGGAMFESSTAGGGIVEMTTR